MKISTRNNIYLRRKAEINFNYKLFSLPRYEKEKGKLFTFVNAFRDGNYKTRKREFLLKGFHFRGTAVDELFCRKY